MSDIKKLQQLIETELQQIAFPSYPSTLYDPVRYMLSIGGKRMRPLLVLIGCELFNGDIKKAIHPALAVEVFHNFTLLHDDIMDNAPVRRSKPTVHVKWNSSTAILSGDAMFVKSIQLLMDTDAAFIPALSEVFNETALRVCEGQQLDMDYESNEATLQQYIKMIELKTAVLLGCSLKMGAIIGNAASADCNHIYDMGCSLGIAFQLQDDLLDLYGDEQSFGKIPGGDIVANKKTFLFLKAIEIASEDQRSQLIAIYNDNAIQPQQKVAVVKSIFDDLQINRHTEEAMEQYYNKAMQMLNVINVPAENKRKLIELSESLRVRVS